MFGKFSYLQYVALFWLIPLFAIIFYPRIIRLISLNKNVLLRGMILVFIVILIGEPIALGNRIWVYPVEKRLGIDLISIPLEDFLLYPIVGFTLLILALIFLDLEERKASMFVWLKTILGLSSLGILITVAIVLLRFLNGVSLF